MSLIVPSVGGLEALQKILNQVLTLKLYSNDLVPTVIDTAASFIEVTGGGYVGPSLTYANWTFTSGDPSYARYLACSFIFTGATDTPRTIYGYYIVDADGILMWSERFPEGLVPFTPIAGSHIKVTPRIEA